MAILQLKRKEPVPVTTKEPKEKPEEENKTPAGEKSYKSSIACSSSAPTPQKAQPEAKLKSPTAISATFALCSLRKQINEETEPTQNGSPADAGKSAQKKKQLPANKATPILQLNVEVGDEKHLLPAEPLSPCGKAMFLLARTAAIIKANASTPEIETLAHLKGEEEWEKMTRDERRPWEEKAGEPRTGTRKAPSSELEVGRKKRAKRPADTPTANKPFLPKPKTSFLMFMDEQRAAETETSSSLSLTEMAKDLSARWKKLTEEERKTYQDAAERAQEVHKMAQGAGTSGERKAAAKKGKALPEPEKDPNAPEKPKWSFKALPEDPNAPKKPKCSFKNKYVLFCDEQRAAVKEQNPGISFSELGKLFSAMWQKLPEEEKSKYKSQSRQAHDKIASLVPALAQCNTEDGGATSGGKKAAPKQVKAKDPNAPKPPKTPFLLYIQAKRDESKAEAATLSPQEFMKHMAEKWKALAEEERQKFDEEAKRLREHYKKAREEYEQGEKTVTAVVTEREAARGDEKAQDAHAAPDGRTDIDTSMEEETAGDEKEEAKACDAEAVHMEVADAATSANDEAGNGEDEPEAKDEPAAMECDNDPEGAKTEASTTRLLATAGDGQGETNSKGEGCRDEEAPRL